MWSSILIKLFARFFKKKRAGARTNFERFAKGLLSQENMYALISDAPEAFRKAIPFALLIIKFSHGFVSLLEDLLYKNAPLAPRDGELSGFEYDEIMQEVLAFTVFYLMAEYIGDSSREDQDEDEDDKAPSQVRPHDGYFEELKAAHTLVIEIYKSHKADSPKSTERILGRVVTFSLYKSKGEDVLGKFNSNICDILDPSSKGSVSLDFWITRALATAITNWSWVRFDSDMKKLYEGMAIGDACSTTY